MNWLSPLKKIVLILFLQIFIYGGVAHFFKTANYAYATPNLSFTFSPASGSNLESPTATGLKVYPEITITATFSEAVTNKAVNTCWRVDPTPASSLRISAFSVSSAASGKGFSVNACDNPGNCGTDVYVCYSGTINIPSDSLSFELGRMTLKQYNSTILPTAVTLTNSAHTLADGTVAVANPSYTMSTNQTTGIFLTPSPLNTWSVNKASAFDFTFKVTHSGATTDQYTWGYSLPGSSSKVDGAPGAHLSGNGGDLNGGGSLTPAQGGTYKIYLFKISGADINSWTVLASNNLTSIDPTVSLTLSPANNQTVNLSGNDHDPYFTASLNFNSGTYNVNDYKLCIHWDTATLELGCPTQVITSNSNYATLENSGYGWLCWKQPAGWTPKRIPSQQLGTVQIHLKNPSTHTGVIHIDTGSSQVVFTTGVMDLSGYGGDQTITFNAGGLPIGTHPNCGPTSTTAPTSTATVTPTGSITPTATSTPPADCPRGELGNLECGLDGKGGEINATDLSVLLTSWGPMPTAAAGYHKADIAPDVLDNQVNSLDLNKLLINWGVGSGNTGTPTPTPTDVASAYPRAPAANYKYYEYQNTDYNTQFPNGAPWGKILVVPWNQLQGGMDPNSLNTAGIDAYLNTAAAQGNPVLVDIEPYEWTTDSSNLSNTEKQEHPCPDGSGDPAKEFGIGTDLTPAFIANTTEKKYAIPVERYVTDPDTGIRTPIYCYPPGSSYECTLVGVPDYASDTYKAAVKVLAQGLGAKYNNNPKIAGFIIGFGADSEYGIIAGNWGGCEGIGESIVQQSGFNVGKYLQLMTQAGPNNDAGDWFGKYLPNKSIYVKVSGAGKEKVPDAMPDWPTNVGLSQASLTPDHNWFQDTAGHGIMDIAMLASTHRPVSWENSWAGFDTSVQYAYGTFLAMLPTFPDYFDFVGGGCFTSTPILNKCNWAKQYYGKSPQTTNEVWIAFQESEWPTFYGGGALQYSGWQRDWEYGLKLNSAKGTTLKKADLVSDFSQAIADAYSGQARKMTRAQTVVLKPVSTWKGLNVGTAYDVTLTYIGGSGHVKVELGDATNGWETQEFDSETGNQWYTKILSFTSGKRPNTIKITPTDNLYVHMVSVKIK